ncbi:complex I LYR family protein [Abortiporus biennis]
MAAVTAPTRDSLLHLYSSMLRTSRQFSSYNFRQYFLRKTKEQFRDIQHENDPAKLSAFYGDRVKELAVLKRSAIVNQLYGGWKLVVEKQKPIRERSDS